MNTTSARALRKDNFICLLHNATHRDGAGAHTKESRNCAVCFFVVFCLSAVGGVLKD